MNMFVSSQQQLQARRQTKGSYEKRFNLSNGSVNCGIFFGQKSRNVGRRIVNLTEFWLVVSVIFERLIWFWRVNGFGPTKPRFQSSSTQPPHQQAKLHMHAKTRQIEWSKKRQIHLKSRPIDWPKSKNIPY